VSESSLHKLGAPCRREFEAARSRAGIAALVAVTTSACAPIDVSSTVSHHPVDGRAGQLEQFGGEQLATRDFQARYLQMGANLLVEIEARPSCVVARHRPVVRVETITRTSRGFVAWDFALGALSGGFASLAFARPQSFSPPLIDGQGRVVHDPAPALIIGGVFAGLGAILLTAGVINAVRATDETRYADAYEVELGAPKTCAEGNHPVASRGLRLRLLDPESSDPDPESESSPSPESSPESEFSPGTTPPGVSLELEAQTDASGRARFRLPLSLSNASPRALPRATPATLEVADGHGGWEPQILMFSLVLPWTQMQGAHTGSANTREVLELTPGPALDLGPTQ